MRTLDDIIPPSRRAAPPETAPPAPAPRPRSRGRFPFITLIVVLLIVAASAGALFYFSSAEVKVTPLSRAASVTNAALTASAQTGDLTFEIISVQKTASQTVTSSGTKAVSSSAQGTVTIYNTQNAAQRLVTNTRFQTTSGLVFRIHTAVTVPAAKNGTPGSATATIYADKSGSEYNVGPTSFTLPGLAGSPLYTQVTAKSSAAMAGGASGNEPVVAAETESATRTALMNSLASGLEADLKAQVPEGYVLLSGATDTSYAPLPTTPGTSSGTAELKQEGTMRGIIFPEAALARAVAENALGAEYKGEGVTLGATDALKLTTKTLPTAGAESFAFSLSGSTSLISTVDPMRIATAIAGKGRGEAESVLKQYPEVQEAVLILRPFWRGSFPDDPTQIMVQVLGVAGN